MVLPNKSKPKSQAYRVSYLGAFSPGYVLINFLHKYLKFWLSGGAIEEKRFSITLNFFQPRLRSLVPWAKSHLSPYGHDARSIKVRHRRVL